MQTIYVFSGLGADKRAFSKLDLSGFDVIHVEWLTPNLRESLQNYVQRLAQYYQIPKHGAHVLGLSFGGICICELAKHYHFEKMVLISSAKTKKELPSSFSVSKLLPLHQLMPSTRITFPSWISNWLFGVNNDEEEQILAEIIQDTDPLFLKWAVDKIVFWDNESIPSNCLHIHGDKDRLIPIKKVNFSIKITNGGHFMVLNKASEISFHIRNYFL